MNGEIKVSIIIPVYNTEEYLRQCLDSVCSQTLKELQIICVDDGSTDKSVDILKEYSERDSRVQILYHEHTGNGAGGARNMGLDYAVGEYLLILDSDDWFAQDLAEKAYKKAKETDADIVLFDTQYVDRFGRYMNEGNQRTVKAELLPDKRVFNVKDCAETLFQLTHGMAWSKLWKRSFIEKNGLRFQCVYWSDDVFFTYAAISVAERITAVSEKLVYYRYNRCGNQSENKDNNPCAPIQIGEELKRFFKDKGVYETVKVSYWQYIVSICMYYLRTTKSFGAYKALADSLREGALYKLLDGDEWRVYFEGEQVDNKMSNVRKSLAKKIDLLMAADREAFLYQEAFGINNGRRVVFPYNLVKKEEKIILYGAGAIGKQYFAQNMENQYCSVVGWVDKSYIDKGFPISAPEGIKRICFDKVIIAIENENVATAIKESLVQIGINEKQILWQYPYE